MPWRFLSHLWIVSLPLCCLLLLSMASFSESPPTSSSCIFCFVHSKQSQGCLFSNWLHLFCLGLFHSIYQQNELNTWIVYCQLNELGKQWDWWGLTKSFTCFNVFWLLKMRLNSEHHVLTYWYPTKWINPQIAHKLPWGGIKLSPRPHFLLLPFLIDLPKNRIT